MNKNKKTQPTQSEADKLASMPPPTPRALPPGGNVITTLVAERILTNVYPELLELFTETSRCYDLGLLEDETDVKFVKVLLRMVSNAVHEEFDAVVINMAYLAWERNIPRISDITVKVKDLTEVKREITTTKVHGSKQPKHKKTFVVAYHGTGEVSPFVGATLTSEQVEANKERGRILAARFNGSSFGAPQKKKGTGKK